MSKYKVSFWFGLNKSEPKVKPNEVIFVETDKKNNKDIISLALKQIDVYPRTYSAEVEDTLFDEYHVIRICNTDEANDKAWYKRMGGQMIVVYMAQDGKYVTCHDLDNAATVGIIESKFCKILTTFKVEDSY